MTASVCVPNSYGQLDVTFGVRAGANFSKFGGSDADIFAEDFEDYGVDIKNVFQPGIQFGVVASFSLNENLMFQPGLIFSQQGGKWKVSGSEDGVKYDVKLGMTLNYLQIPLNFQYKHDLENDLSLLLQAGPYLGYWIKGKMKMKVSASEGGTSMNVSNTEKVKFGSGDDADFKAFDFGLGVGAGFQYGNIQAVLGGNFGLAKLDPDVNMKNIGLAFTVTYLFGK